MRSVTRFWIGALLVIALSIPALAQKQSGYEVTRFSCDSKPTVVQGLSNAGDAAGYTMESLEQAQLGNPANYKAHVWYWLTQQCMDLNLTNIGGTPVHGAQAMGINRSRVTVGFAYTSTVNTTDSVGWLLQQNGLIVRVTHPLDVNHNRTRLSGINDDGRITGWYLEDAGGGTLIERGFILEPDLTTFTFLPIAGASAPYSISNTGVVTGWMQPPGGARSGFILNSRGRITTVAALELRQIDSSQEVAAFAEDGSITSYIYSPKGNKLKVVDSPDAGTSLMLNAINDAGQIGGAIISPSSVEGYIRSPARLRFR